jgi:hypothetical protein
MIFKFKYNYNRDVIFYQHKVMSKDKKGYKKLRNDEGGYAIIYNDVKIYIREHKVSSLLIIL